MSIGIDEARQWLADNANEWIILRAESMLVAGVTMGAPTQQEVSVELTERLQPGGISLMGEGHTILDAVQRAIGSTK